MAVLRGPIPADNFTLIDNAWLRDPRISWKAKGLLAYIGSHAPGHQLTQEQMLAEGRDKIDGIRTAIDELCRAGYLVSHDVRNELGHRVGTDYTLTDPGNPQVGKSDLGSQSSDQQERSVSAGQAQTGKSQVGKSDPKKTTSSKKTKEDDFSDADAPTAQTILGKFIDWLALPEQHSVKLTGQVIKRYGAGIKQLLSEGFDELTIRRALAEMHHSGASSWPAQLPSYVVKVQAAAAKRAPAEQFKTAAEKTAERKEQRMARARAIDTLTDQGVPFDDAKARVDAEIAKGVDICTVSRYIDGVVIDATTVREVTG